MPGLSAHASLLLDLARQEAKRRSHSVVLPCHVVAALQNRDGEEATSRLEAGLLDTNARRLESLPTSYDSIEVDPATIELLEPIRRAGDEWEHVPPFVTKWLAEAPETPAKRRDAPPESARAEHPAGSGSDEPAPGGVPGPPDTVASVLASFVEERAAALDGLADLPARSGEVAWVGASPAEALVLDDVLAAVAAVVTADALIDDAEGEHVLAFFAERGLPEPSKALEALPAWQQSPVLLRLVEADAADASDLARSYAVGLIGIARLAAAVDGSASPEEARAIDQLRLALRAVLPASGADAAATPSATGERRSPAAVLADLDALIGLEGVKTEIRTRVEWFRMMQLRRERGLPVEAQSMHMAFLGNPGTGKTTVARLLAELLASLGFLRKGHLVEADRTALVSKYLGGTAHAVRETVERALGGVLFIDEAYTLANAVDSSGGDQYDREAVDMLVQLIEEHRDDLVVIVAGYRGPMEQFLRMNEGLASRVPSWIVFPDYSIDELMAVFQRFAEARGQRFTPDALERARAWLTAARAQPGFGNARTVRNLFEHCLRRQAHRLADLGDLATDDELATIVLDDVPESERAEPERRGDAPGYV